jgi:hypothetical protein
MYRYVDSGRLLLGRVSEVGKDWCSLHVVQQVPLPRSWDHSSDWKADGWWWEMEEECGRLKARLAGSGDGLVREEGDCMNRFDCVGPWENKAGPEQARQEFGGARDYTCCPGCLRAVGVLLCLHYYFGRLLWKQWRCPEVEWPLLHALLVDQQAGEVFALYGGRGVRDWLVDAAHGFAISGINDHEMAWWKGGWAVMRWSRWFDGLKGMR